MEVQRDDYFQPRQISAFLKREMVLVALPHIGCSELQVNGVLGALRLQAYSDGAGRSRSKASERPPPTNHKTSQAGLHPAGLSRGTSSAGLLMQSCIAGPHHSSSCVARDFSLS
jgi:hypothetical protein